MQTSIIALALVGAVSARNYQPLQTNYNGVASCIARGPYDASANCWGLKVAACGNPSYTYPAFNFGSQAGYVKTANNLCLQPVNGVVVLAPCKPACKGWNYLQGNYWSNANGCLTYDAAGRVVYGPCTKAQPAVLQGCKVTPAPAPAVIPATPAAPAVPAPVVAQQTCAYYVNYCPAGSYVPSNYYNYAATATSCVNTCCVRKPTPAPATCYDFAAAAGYPMVNPCAPYGQFNPAAQRQACSGQRNFIQSCCIATPPAPSTCAAFTCPYGYQKLLDSGFAVCNGPCRVSDCCSPNNTPNPNPPTPVQTCSTWGAAQGFAPCGANYILKNFNAVCGNNCQATCCMQLMPTPQSSNLY